MKHSELTDIARPFVKEAMQEGGKLALDSCVRVIGMLVEKFTLTGKPHEAMGAAGAMELVKELRKHSDGLYDAQPPGDAPRS